MNAPVIRPFKESDYSRVKTIMFEAFKNKFNHLMNVEEETLFNMMVDLGVYYKQPFDGYWVAELNGGVVGVIVLKWHEPSMLIRHDHKSIPALLRAYGLRNTFKLVSIGIVLEQQVSKGECYVESLAVAKEARGMGIGTRLLNKGIDLAKLKVGINKFALSVVGSNQGAISLYKSLGLEISRTTEDFALQKMFGERCFHYMSMSVE